MKIKRGPFAYAPGIFAAVVIAAGCSGTSSTNPVSSAGSQAPAGRARSMDTVQTRVKIFNFATYTITGSGSSACWTISPTPLPSIAPSSSSQVETLQYNTGCGASNELDITYSGGSPPAPCIFKTTYSSGFTYLATNSVGTACTATRSSNVTYDENFNYYSAGSPAKALLKR